MRRRQQSYNQEFPHPQFASGQVSQQKLRCIAKDKSSRSQVAASAPNRPPTSKTDDHQAAAASAHELGRRCVGRRGWASPARVTGLTMVASTASARSRRLRCGGHPWPGHRCSCQPGERCGRPSPRLPGTPSRGRALWSPRGVQATLADAHARGATGSGKRSRRNSKTRRSGDGTVNSAEPGKTVKARARPVTAAVLEMRHQCEKDENQPFVSLARAPRCCQHRTNSPNCAFFLPWPTGPPTPSAQQRPQAGRGAGGAFCPWRRSRQSPARPWEAPGCTRRRPNSATARRSTPCSTSLVPPARAACRCGPDAGLPGTADRSRVTDWSTLRRTAWQTVKRCANQKK